MSAPYPPQPRRLMRDPSNKLIGGVCSGVAKYLNMDVNLVRIVTVIISLFTGIPIVLYILALFLLPEERNEPQPPHVNGPQASGYGPGFPGQQAYGQPGYGQPAQQPVNDVWGPGGAPWEQPQAAASPTPYTPYPSAPTPSPEQQTWPQPPADSPQQEPVSGPEPEQSPGETAPDSAPTDPEPARDTDKRD